MSLALTPLKITKANNSRREEVDFDNLVFGKVFTDHMFVCDYENGSWQTPQIVPYGPISLEPSAKVFHYGQAVFEGMKAYKDPEGKTWLFRPDQNYQRINKSLERLAMPAFPESYFFDGLNTLLKMDDAWIPTAEGSSLYIRPFAIATESGVSASPSTKYKFMIILSPAQSYYSGEVRVQIAEKYSRAASGGTGYAKAAGNYAGQFFPTKLANEAGFQQVIWTDASNHEYLEEAGTMNVFFRINDTLLTAPVSDRILDGVTRKSILTLAKDNHFKVEERPVLVSEIVDAAQKGDLKEIFGAGTAAIVSPVCAFSHQGKTFELPKIHDSFAERFKTMLNDIQYNRAEDPYNWRYAVK
ncbi:MAG: branched-chain amino acid aminotransferase [Bacteroidetes bacterium]|nr:branched-chain amino acid aminotransferase [Bacteroidota bacterium]